MKVSAQHINSVVLELGVTHGHRYLTIIETMHLPCTIFELFCQKFPILTYPTCIWHYCLTLCKFRRDLWYQKTRIPGLLCGIVGRGNNMFGNVHVCVRPFVCGRSPV